MCGLFDVYRVYPDSLEELRYTFSIRNKRHHSGSYHNKAELFPPSSPSFLSETSKQRNIIYLIIPDNFKWISLLHLQLLLYNGLSERSMVCTAILLPLFSFCNVLRGTAQWRGVAILRVGSVLACLVTSLSSAATSSRHRLGASGDQWGGLYLSLIISRTEYLWLDCRCLLPRGPLWN